MAADVGVLAGSVNRPPARLVAEAVCVCVGAAVVVALCGSSPVRDALPQPVSEQVLTLASAVVAAGAAAFGGFAAVMLDDPRPRWIAAAMAVYALVVLPSITFAVNGVDTPAPVGRLIAHLFVVALLTAAVRPPPVSTLGTWVIAATGVIVSAFVLVTQSVIPVPVRELLDGPLASIVVVAWPAIAAALMVEGYQRQNTARWRAGLGLWVLAGAQVVRLVTSGDEPEADMIFVGLRLLGLLVIFAGLALLVNDALHDLRSEYLEQQEELCAAAQHMQRAAELAAERNHELRNGLAGLAGITHLLSSRAAGADHARLKHAVLAELSRLHAVLDGWVPHVDTAEYAVEPVVDGLALLRRSSGSSVDLDVEPDLRARGHPAVLAQVVTNLLDNCERHAPGARIWIRAYQHASETIVEVRDNGPGLPAHVDDVLQRGVHDPEAGGRGWGLYISRELVEREGGTLSLRTVENPRGCVATVTVPAPTTPPIQLSP